MFFIYLPEITAKCKGVNPPSVSFKFRLIFHFSKKFTTFSHLFILIIYFLNIDKYF